MIKKILDNKGFSLIECIIAIAVFAIMAVIVFQILTITLKQQEVNNAALEHKNEQLKENAENIEPPSSITNIIIDFGGAEIKGDIPSYSVAASDYSILSPVLGLSEYEYDLLDKNGHKLEGTSKLYSTVTINIANIKEVSHDIDGSNHTAVWKLTLDYDADLPDAYVIYLKIPNGTVNELITNGNSNAHLIQYSTNTFVRITDLAGTGTNLTVSFSADTTDYDNFEKWFLGTIGSTTELILTKDGNNYK